MPAETSRDYTHIHTQVETHIDSISPYCWRYYNITHALHNYARLEVAKTLAWHSTIRLICVQMVILHIRTCVRYATTRALSWRRELEKGRKYKAVRSTRPTAVVRRRYYEDFSGRVYLAHAARFLLPVGNGLFPPCSSTFTLDRSGNRWQSC